MNNCVGCGTQLQSEDKEKIGYTKNIENNLCERCFRIKNYGEYKIVTKNNQEFIEILKEVNEKKDLTILVVDIFNLSKDIKIIERYLTNEILLVITKKDILPKKISDEKLLNYFNEYKLNIIDKIVVSSYKNYNFDKLYELIHMYKKSKNVYVVGFTNSGKSTMINKIIYNYSDNDEEITTSILPSTTLNKIKIKINDDLNIIDTPGILLEKSYYEILNGKQLKKIIPRKEIKPVTYQIKNKQYILIDDYAMIEAENINITLFISNQLKINRIYKKPEINLKNNELYVENCDIVISGLGFIKCTGKGKIKVYTYEDISVYTRKCLI